MPKTQFLWRNSFLKKKQKKVDNWKNNINFYVKVFNFFNCSGEGQFGDVYRGVYKPNNSSEQHSIAVKTCKVVNTK